MVSSTMARGLVLGSLVLGLLLPGCKRSPVLYPRVEGPLLEGEGLRVGVISSSRQFYGRHSVDATVDAAYLLRDRVNQCGGVNQAPISLAMEHTNPSTRNKIAAVEELLETHHIHGAIASLDSIKSARSLQLMREAQIPALLFAYHGTVAEDLAPALKQLQQSPSQGYWGQLSPSSQDTIDALAQVIWNQGYTQVAIIHADQPSSQEWTTTFTQSFEKLGGERTDRDTPIVMSPSNANGAPSSNTSGDEAGAASQLEDGDRPNAGFRFDSEQEAQLSAWLIQDQTATVVALDRFQSVEFMEALLPLTADQESVPLFWANWLELQAGLEIWLAAQQRRGSNNNPPNLVGTTGITPAIVGNGFIEFEQAWNQQFEDDPPADAAYAWDAVALLALAAEAAGNSSGANLAAHLGAIASPPGANVTNVCEGLERLRNGETIDFEGASGSLNLNASGMAASQFNLWRITPSGDPTVIDRVAPSSDTPF